MIIVENLILKKIVQVFKENGVKVLDDGFKIKPYSVYITNSTEIGDGAKDFDRSHLIFEMNCWGEKNGSRIDMALFKRKMVSIINSNSFEGDYIIDSVGIDEVALFKEIDGNNNSGSNHYFHLVLNLNFKVRGK